MAIFLPTKKQKRDSAVNENHLVNELSHHLIAL